MSFAIGDEDCVVASWLDTVESVAGDGWTDALLAYAE